MWAYFHHLFLPHESNNHRPKTLHPQALVFYIVFLLLLQFGISSLKTWAPNILGIATDINVEKLAALTNQKRVESGLAPLNLDSSLSQAAAGKANDMFGKNYWAHNSPDGLTPWVFIKNAGYSYLYAGENLAKNFNDSDGVVNAWMASSSHKENLLNPKYQDIGFAVVNGRINGEETTLVVQMFGAKQPLAVAVPKKPASEVAQPPPAGGPKVEVTPVQVTPTPTMTLPRELAKVPQTTMVAAVKTTPLLNAPTLTRHLSLIILAGLIFILGLDAALIWRRKTVRLSGHNLAHLVFLAGLLGVLWLTKPGVVL